ncbi:MAG: DEAD/DEAH box helicase, partial [Acidobacteria bacterium]|nr:DEAD/DEAH box helicase [Acidobacteriota bacterium]
MNAIEVTQTLHRNYIRYLLTTFNVGRTELELADALQREWAKPGALFRGPFLEFNPPYAHGHSLRELTEAGVVSEALCRLREDIAEAHQRPLPPDRPLYVHQESALRHVLANRNLVVASGTGSGKTECFLIPILHDLLTDSSPGVRALLIYPMNALVNDQLERLRNLLKGTGITFGRYTSELEEYESEGRRKNDKAPENEIVSREAMRGHIKHSSHPPQILITNYAMLEYLLLRPQDAPIFASGLWRFVCLDEAHTYTGAQGIEVSLLLRRLKHRLGKQAGELRCIATSATLVRDDADAAVQFATHLFGEAFTRDDVI